MCVPVPEEDTALFEGERWSLRNSCNLKMLSVLLVEDGELADIILFRCHQLPY